MSRMMNHAFNSLWRKSDPVAEQRADVFLDLLYEVAGVPGLDFTGPNGHPVGPFEGPWRAATDREANLIKGEIHVEFKDVDARHDVLAHLEAEFRRHAKMFADAADRIAAVDRDAINSALAEGGAA